MRTTTAKLDMIKAAERLVAERGVANVSLREVQKASGQRNKSAAAYHFGTKEGLLAAILDYRMGPINHLRAAHLDALAGADGATLHDLVRALIDPLVACTVREPESGYARFLARTEADPAFLPLVRSAEESSSYRRWRAMIADELTHLPSELRFVRIDRVVAIVIQALALWEEGRGKRGQRLDLLIADLVESCVGLLSAPDPTGGASSDRDLDETAAP